jgi:hypothetical protein
LIANDGKLRLSVFCAQVANEVQAGEGLQSDGDDYYDDLGEAFC